MDRWSRRGLLSLPFALALRGRVLTFAQTKKLKIGATTLIWGGLPRTPENLEPALKDISDLGYNGFETFAQILEDWDRKGTLAAHRVWVPRMARYTGRVQSWSA